MKKLLISFLLIFCATYCLAQKSFGPYTVFPNKKLLGLSYKPQLGVAKIDDIYCLVLNYTSPSDYASFDEESVLLLKFEDNTNVKLPLFLGHPIEKSYNNELNQLTKSIIHYYKTFTCFQIEEDVLARITQNKEKIIKIRVSFTNGVINDWDIDEKWQPKFIAGLIESYKKVEDADVSRKKNINNVEDGF